MVESRGAGGRAIDGGGPGEGASECLLNASRKFDLDGGSDDSLIGDGASMSDRPVTLSRGNNTDLREFDDRDIRRA